MVNVSLNPIFAVPGALIEAITTHRGFSQAQSDLMRRINRFDEHFITSIAPEPAEGGTDYVFHPRLINLESAHQDFLSLRRLREDIDQNFSLLSPAAALADYISHMTVNILAVADPRPRRLAHVAPDGNITSFHFDGPCFEHSLSVYFGLSPYPVFGVDLAYDSEDVSSRLSEFGLGLYALLGLARDPQLADQERLPMTLPDGQERRLATASVRRDTDQSIRLMTSQP